ncbi:phosphodiesterase [Ectothiorhodospiraceae bacterium BW-2]|nr:phosphodiesterase [Ectothiorhodospiraceae bacterium BW-2]
MINRCLLQSQRFASELLETVAAVVTVIDSEGRIVCFNRAAERVTGFTREEIVGQPVWEWVIPQRARQQVIQVFHSLMAGNFPSHHINPWLCKDGHEVVLEWSNSALLDSDGEVAYVVATGIDMTEIEQSRRELQIAAVAFETHEAIAIISPEARFLRVNGAFSRITGYLNSEVVGQSTSLLKSGQHDKQFYQQLWQSLLAQGSWSGEIWNRRKSGEIYPEYLRITAVRDLQGKLTHYVATFTDLSDIREAEEQLNYHSRFDEITNLPNQRFFLEKLHRQQGLLQRQHKRALLFYIHLLQFNELQVNIGRVEMENFLIEVAKLLHQLHSTPLESGYLGSGNFVLLAEIAPNHSIYHHAIRVVESLFEELQAGFGNSGEHFFPRATVGVTTLPQSRTLPEEILHQGWLAAESAWQISGANSFQLFSRDIQKAAYKSHQLDIALRYAVSRDELELYYQPQYNQQQQLIGAEALLRWHRDGEFVSPAEFIPLAEKSNLILDIGNWVLQRTVRDSVQLLHGCTLSSFKAISMNVSAMQLAQPDFVDQLQQQLNNYHLAPKWLKLELTETSMINDPMVVRQQLTQIRRLGVKIALDDFGTGYSSLAYLANMPIDQLKIDQSFVKEMNCTDTSRVIVNMIIQMARSMNMEVIAEGVESKEQLQLLQQMACYQFQGFYFAKPMPFDDLLQLVRVDAGVG